LDISYVNVSFSEDTKLNVSLIEVTNLDKKNETRWYELGIISNFAE